jgi:hypothetical protein
VLSAAKFQQLKDNRDAGTVRDELLDELLWPQVGDILGLLSGGVQNV